MLTATPSYLREVARALSSPPVRLMATRIVGEDDGLDAIQTVAARMLERDRVGNPRPRNLEHYLVRAVRRECFRIYKRQQNVDIDKVVVEGEFILRREVPIEVASMITIAFDEIRESCAKQAELTYWDEIPVRDGAGRGVPTGTAARKTMLAKAQLRAVEETHVAAHALGIGRRQFEPVDPDAWARECARMERTCSGIQTVELVEVWTSLALAQQDPIDALDSVKGWAQRIVGATIEQMDAAAYLINEHWSVANPGLGPVHTCEEFVEPTITVAETRDIYDADDGPWFGGYAEFGVYSCPRARSFERAEVRGAA